MDEHVIYTADEISRVLFCFLSGIFDRAKSIQKADLTENNRTFRFKDFFTDPSEYRVVF